MKHTMHRFLMGGAVALLGTVAAYAQSATGTTNPGGASSAIASGWSAMMAPIIMGNPDRPELSAELEASFIPKPLSEAGLAVFLDTLDRRLA